MHNFYLYNIIYLLLLPAIIIRLLIKNIHNKNHSQRIFERFGIIKYTKLNNKPIIWIHCVSVGEFLATIPIIDTIIKQNKYQLLITSTTPTGSNAIIDKYNNKVLHYYLPFDVGLFLRHFIKKIQPKILIIIETEIWANLIYNIDKKNIPIILANARLSNRSYNNYQKFSKLSKFIINKITHIAAQNQQTINNFKKLGVADNKISLVGNVKFDIDINQKLTNIDNLTNIVNNRTIILFASTHKGEDEAIISQYNAYKKQLKNTLIVIAPRHLDRVKNIITALNNAQISYIKRSENIPITNTQEVLILDTLGELRSLYKLCTIAFVGGSLVPRGGHNMLEALVFKKCVIFGNNMHNFPSIAKDLLSVGGAREVIDAQHLWDTILELHKNSKQRQQLGANGYNFFINNNGASAKIWQLIEDVITV